MSCFNTIADYGLRSLGVGKRLLPKSDITLCEQVVLIGSGVLWNIYFGIVALSIGFIFANLLAVGKFSAKSCYNIPCKSFIFLFRGSPLFIQFFFAYELFVLLPKITGDLNLGYVTLSISTDWLTKAWLGALIVLFLNTSAYSAQIFYGALRAIPIGEIEAADAYGISGYKRFRKIIWPTMLRFAWPAYTNEAIFMFHATTLIFFSGFPAWRQSGDALYYANYFADKTFNPFIPYPIAAGYFILLTLLIIFCFRLIENYLNRHLQPNKSGSLKISLNLIR